ncbi:MAG TPA: hypothetical protein VMV49_09375, partial [Candidatus Deferrimicrobium sp.]|nr:hypothetical protein [Candidatus Deferrimicrobium sp.]
MNQLFESDMKKKRLIERGDILAPKRNIFQTIKIIIIGFGNIGRNLAKMILKKEDFLLTKFSVSVLITGIIDIDYSI